MVADATVVHIALLGDPVAEEPILKEMVQGAPLAVIGSVEGLRLGEHVTQFREVEQEQRGVPPQLAILQRTSRMGAKPMMRTSITPRCLSKTQSSFN